MSSAFWTSSFDADAHRISTVLRYGIRSISQTNLEQEGQKKDETKLAAMIFSTPLRIPQFDVAYQRHYKSPRSGRSHHVAGDSSTKRIVITSCTILLPPPRPW